MWWEALSACPPGPLQSSYSGDDVWYVQPITSEKTKNITVYFVNTT